MDVFGGSGYLKCMRKVDSGMQVWLQECEDFEGTLLYYTQLMNNALIFLEAKQVLIFHPKFTGCSVSWKRVGSAYVETSRIQIHHWAVHICKLLGCLCISMVPKKEINQSPY